MMMGILSVPIASILVGKYFGNDKKAIAFELNRHISTIYREIERNTGQRGYRPKQAQLFANRRRQGAYKHRKLTEPVIDSIKKLLKQELSAFTQVPSEIQMPYQQFHSA